MAKKRKGEIAPGEAVGTVAAQSLGEPGTQMSTSADEKVIIKIGSEIRIVKIGEFVDSIMGKFGSKKLGRAEVYDFPRKENIFALSLNQNEKLKWKKIISCSRHKNSKKLMKIRTASGREITATDNHSFVIRADNKVTPIVGKKLNVGDRIPVMKYLPENCNTMINIEPLLPNNFITIKEENTLRSRKGFTPIPETFELNDLFGWFIGAYLSEGCATTHGEVSISNTNTKFISNLKQFAERFNLRYGEFKHNRGFSHSHDFKIRSTIFSQFILNICRTGSDKKIVPDFAYSACEEFVSGLLRGYFDGDGNVTVKRKMIRISSNSENLIDGIKLLLTRFGIFARKTKGKKQILLLIPYKYAPIFLSKIGSDIKDKKKKLKQLAKLAEGFLNNKSQDYTEMTCNFGNILYDIAKKLGYRTRYVNNFTKRQRIGITTLSHYTALFERLAKEKNANIKNEINILKRMLNADVVWDKITEISYVTPTSKYVYDFSVSGLETFTTFDGIVTHNTMRTFHYAGVAEQVPTGLPRVIEIVDARRTPKKPFMDIYIKPQYVNNKKKVAQILSEIEHTTLGMIGKIREDLASHTILIKLNEKELKARGLVIKDIKQKIKEKMSEVEIKTKKDVLYVKFKKSDAYK
ncbi:intein-containing DNA-directed RNA polymerase subunit A'', partial [Candidatus Woesearchaeota archaeon]